MAEGVNRPDRYWNRKRKRDRQFIAQRIDALWAGGGMPLIEYLNMPPSDLEAVVIKAQSIGVATVTFAKRNG